MKPTKVLATFVVAACFAGCEDQFDPGGYSTLEAPVAVGDRFVQLDVTHRDLWFFTPGDGRRQLDISQLELPHTPHSLHPMPDGRLAVLTQDEPGLYVVGADGPSIDASFELGAGYDALAISPDSRFVIAHFAPNSAGTDDAILFTANQITIIDLGDGETEPSAREFTLADRAPLRFEFAPTLTLTDPDVPLYYAVAIAESAVSVIDLTTENEADRQRIIPLTEPASGRTLVAQDILFSTDDPSDPFDVTMFVLASGSAEIFAIDLLPADPATGRMLQPAINQISGGSRPESMHAFQSVGRDKLLVLDSGARQLSVVDVPTSSVTAISLDRSITGALVWDQVISGEVRPRALLYSPGSSIVYFAELDALERQGTGALRAVSLGQPVGTIEAVDSTGDRKAVARYESGAGLDVINLEQRRVISIPARAQLSEFEIVGEWLFAVTPSVERLVAVELSDASPVEVDIVAPGRTLEVAGDTILVSHDDPAGWVTAYSAATFFDGEYAEAYGYTLDGLFERGE